ncbi:substrate-binding domain-containing protein [Undibacterium sp. Ji67W]|uniref:substrate-binding domain-containing protein n=1 Tax=Undibacterium sp. Ji67W TaxID=3413042 RepID=UPI003BF03DB2
MMGIYEEIMNFVRSFWICLLYIFLCGCGHSDSSGSSSTFPSSLAPEPSSKYKVALVLKTFSNPFFVDIEKGARRAEQELGIELIVKTAGQETAIEQQIQIVQGLIEQKVNAIVIAPGDSRRLIPVLKEADKAGIAIINIDNQLDPHVLHNYGMNAVPFISVDNERASFAAVKSVIEKIDKPTQVAIIEGLPGAENARMRMIGAVRAFNSNPVIQIVAKETAHWKIDEAHKVAKHIFEKYPAVQVIFCANDMMALGAIKYISDSGRKNVQVIGYDALDDAKAAIRAGQMRMTVDQQSAVQGYQGVVLAVRALKGEKVPSMLTVETHLVSVDTLK